MTGTIPIRKLHSVSFPRVIKPQNAAGDLVVAEPHA